VRNPEHRLNAEQILQHPWVVGEGTPKDNLPEVPKMIQEYTAKRRLKKAGQAIIAVQRLNKLLFK